MVHSLDFVSLVRSSSLPAPGRFEAHPVHWLLRPLHAGHVDLHEIGLDHPAGCVGFLRVADLRAALGHRREGMWALVPEGRGAYLVVREGPSEPVFVPVGPGGAFKGRDPNVDVRVLESAWVPGARVVYVGRSSSLRERLRGLVSFGLGRPVGHWGGRYLWQLADASELRVCWRETPDRDPDALRSELLALFESRYGRLPFANVSS